MTTDVGEIDTERVASTVTDVGVAGVAVATGVAAPDVPVSVIVTVRTQVVVAPVGM
jgi:hypothetical protein